MTATPTPFTYKNSQLPNRGSARTPSSPLLLDFYGDSVYQYPMRSSSFPSFSCNSNIHQMTHDLRETSDDYEVFPWRIVSQLLNAEGAYKTKITAMYMANVSSIFLFLRHFLCLFLGQTCLGCLGQCHFRCF